MSVCQWQNNHIPGMDLFQQWHPAPETTTGQKIVLTFTKAGRDIACLTITAEHNESASLEVSQQY
ncbi:MAG: hypothetical protein NTV68_01000 [Methanomicrobiales archaeon]|nr:hypothetical protein [Methanomicrobiales archaeon]